MKVSIIGAGRVGLSLVKLLKDKFVISGICEKNEEKFDKIKTLFPGIPIKKNPHETALISEVIFITTQDDIIEKTCNEIFQNNNIKYKTVFHCSGSLPSSILYSAKEKLCNIGSIHPLQTVPDHIKGPENLKKAYFSIEGDTEAIEIAKEIIENISGKYFIISPDVKSLYHLGAVFCSNFINTIIFVAFNIFKKLNICLSDKEFVEIVSPLFEASISGIKELGLINSLTGPVIRGDVNTLKRHLEGIEKSAPEIKNLYKELVLMTLNLAKEKVDSEKINKIEEIMEKFYVN